MLETPREMPNGCEYCDEPGGERTYRNQMTMPLNGRVRCLDRCIGHIVAALNAGGIRTAASCCGHMKHHGSIVLEDGRELLIRKYVEGRYPPPLNES